MYVKGVVFNMDGVSLVVLFACCAQQKVLK